MKFKTLSAVAVGATLVALDAQATEATPMSADPFHWSTAFDQLTARTTRKIQYNRKSYVVPDNLDATAFIEECFDTGGVVRMRGFVNRQGKPEWSRAEFLCSRSIGGSELPPQYANPKEIKIFGQGPTTLPYCEPQSKAGKRIWTECGILVPNDGSSTVRIGEGRNTGRVMETASTGSGIDTVEPVLLPEVEQMRERIFRQRVEAGYYNRSV